jgi:phosphoribosylamine--glycine ligase
LDAFEKSGLRIFGPNAAAARLETDKIFAKQLMRQYAVPTADARTFTDFQSAHEYIQTRDEPVVVKAAGLAKGKGVIVCNDPADAILAAENMLVKRAFGDAGAAIVVEERLLGREVSLLAVVDRHTSYLLEPAEDYKRLRDNDEGPNTGGMGALCPSTLLDDHTLQQIQTQILIPVLDGLVRQGMPYRGVLYLGLMLTTAGPKVLEFNCRFGDPETQALLPRLRSDLLELLWRAALGEELPPAVWSQGPAVGVVLASRGYPASSSKGDVISGLDEAAGLQGVEVLHSGTAMSHGDVVTAGGRVLTVTAVGASFAEARRLAYEGVARIKFDGAQHRTDIALRAEEWERDCDESAVSSAGQKTTSPGQAWPDGAS